LNDTFELPSLEEIQEMERQRLQAIEGDKEATSYNDIFDAFRPSLKFYCYEERTD
jgi:hypothetical protein